MLIHLISAILPAARGRHHAALAEFVAAGQVQALMVGEHALTSRVTAWTIATQARLGKVERARATLAALDDRLASAGEIRNAAAVVRLAEQDPAGARRELQTVLDGGAPVKTPTSPSSKPIYWTHSPAGTWATSARRGRPWSGRCTWPNRTG